MSVESKRKWRLKYPMKAAYNTLKYNAKRRGKEFNLTFEQFKEFAVETELLTARGRKPTSYSIDRIDNCKGYTPDNIQRLTIADNARKKNHREYYWDEHDHCLKILTKSPQQDDTNDPF